jgi:hypothetical protein
MRTFNSEIDSGGNLKLKTLRNTKFVLAIMFIVGITSLAAEDDDTQSRIRQGFAIAPVQLKLGGLNPALVGLGSYYVNGSAGCIGCHTSPTYLTGGNPFLGQPELINKAGYLGGGAAFGPVIVSRNLTPNSSGKPAGLTLDEFFEVMRHGTDLKNLAPPVPSPTMDLLQVMPWPEYTKMTDRDLRAIYEYLRAVPCLEGGPGVVGPRCTEATRR